MANNAGGRLSQIRAVANGNASVSGGGPMKKQRAPQIRYTRFIFTVNNWKQEEWDWLTEVLPPLCKWIMIAKETCPTTGTPHLQGAAILNKQTARSTVAKWLGFR